MGKEHGWRGEGAESGGRLEDDVDCVTDKLFSLPWDYARLPKKHYSATDTPRATKPRQNLWAPRLLPTNDQTPSLPDGQLDQNRLPFPANMPPSGLRKAPKLASTSVIFVENPAVLDVVEGICCR